MQSKDLMKQLSRRRVFRAAVIYAAFVWVAQQVADVFAWQTTVTIGEIEATDLQSQTQRLAKNSSI